MCVVLRLLATVSTQWNFGLVDLGLISLSKIFADFLIAVFLFLLKNVSTRYFKGLRVYFSLVVNILETQLKSQEQWVPGLFPGVKSGWSFALTTHPT